MYVKTVDQGNGGPVHVVVIILQIRSIIIPISCEITFLLLDVYTLLHVLE